LGAWAWRLLVAGLACCAIFIAFVSGAYTTVSGGQGGPILYMIPGAAPALEMQASDQRLNPAATKLLIPKLQAAVREEPLRADTLTAIALLRAKAEGSQAAFPMMLRGLAMDPRSVGIRRWLLAYYLQTGRSSAAAAQIDRLLSLSFEDRGRLLVALSLVAKDEAARPVVKEMLRSHPAWSPLFFETMLEQGADPGLWAAFLSEANDQGRSAYIRSLLRSGNTSQARLYRDHLLEEQGGKREVADELFQGRGAAAPFTWSLKQSDSGSAELRSGGGLELSYVSGSPAVFADQMLLLRPGRYVLRVRGHVDGSVPSANLSVQLRCGGARSLGSVQLPAAAEPTDVRAAFSVPVEGCDTQIVSIESAAADSSVDVSGALNLVRVEKVQ
jgi:hypothetical protein